MNELFENISCDLSNCMLRHHNTCKWYREFGRCKFNPCAFKHIGNSVEILQKLKQVPLEDKEKVEKLKLNIEKLFSESNKSDAMDDIENKKIITK